MKEIEIQKEIMLALDQAGCLVFRNNVGLFWSLDKLRKVVCGLCKGSSDIIGMAPDGRFLAVEVKTPTGRPSKSQQNFITAVNHRGGVAFIARSKEEAIQKLKEAIKKASD